MTCIAPDKFIELLEAGRLDHPDPDVAQHLAECGDCRDAWAAIGAADEVLPSLRPLRRKVQFRALPAIAAALLLTVLGSFLWVGGGDRRPGQASAPTLQDSQKELQALIEQLKSDDATARERAEKSITDLITRIGKDGFRWLREQRQRATHPEVKARLASVLQRLLEPKVLWTQTLEGSSFAALAPSVDERLCVFSSQKSFTAVETATGKTLWRAPGDYRARSFITPEAVFVSVPKGPGVGIQALRPLSGEKLWFHGIADLWNPAPKEPFSYYHDADFALSGRWLYAGSRPGSLICLDAATGERRWATPGGARETALACPTILGGSVFAARWNQALMTFDAETGKLRWEVKTPGIGFLAPVAMGDRIFVVTHDLGMGKPDEQHGECLAYSAARGDVLWKTDLAAFGKGGMALLRVGSTLVVQANTHLLGLSPESGALLWSIPNKRMGYSTLARDERGRVYAGGDDGALLVADASSGKRLLRFDPNTLPQAEGAPKVRYGEDRLPDLGNCGSPGVLGRNVFFMTESGLAVALRIPEFLGEDQ